MFPYRKSPVIEKYSVVNRYLTNVITLLIVCLLLIISVAGCGFETKQRSQQPIIDVHVHAFGDDGGYGAKDFYGNPGSANSEMLFQETYERFRKYNIIKAVVSGPLDAVETWKSKDEDNRIIRGVLTCGPDDGMTTDPNNKVDPARFESLVKSGKIEVFGEIEPMLVGMKISDPYWQPYLAVCEKNDIPVMVHTSFAVVPGFPKARQLLGDPYLVEDVLVRYPKLRIWICHFGSEWRDHTLALMLCYPNLYTDLGAMLWADPLQKKWAKEFLSDAKLTGILDRVMFGSDQILWPHGIELSIEYLNSLDFLTERDKRDILYNNAARFLKLEEGKFSYEK